MVKIYKIYIFSRDGKCLFTKKYSKDVKIEDEEGDDVVHSIQTDTYKLHYYESHTGYKFFLFTDPKCGDLQGTVEQIYKSLFVEYVIKNPLYKFGDPIDCHVFESKLDAVMGSLKSKSSRKLPKGGALKKSN